VTYFINGFFNVSIHFTYICLSPVSQLPSRKSRYSLCEVIAECRAITIVHNNLTLIDKLWYSWQPDPDLVIKCKFAARDNAPCLRDTRSRSAIYVETAAVLCQSSPITWQNLPVNSKHQRLYTWCVTGQR